MHLSENGFHSILFLLLSQTLVKDQYKVKIDDGYNISWQNEIE